MTYYHYYDQESTYKGLPIGATGKSEQKDFKSTGVVPMVVTYGGYLWWLPMVATFENPFRGPCLLIVTN